MKAFGSFLALLGLCAVFVRAAQVEYLFGDDESLDNSSSLREGRVFPFVAVVRLPDETCGKNMMTQGICKTKKQCQKQGGSTIDGVTCGGGYGVCCKFQTTCSSKNGNGITVTTSGTQIKNPTSNNLPPTNCQINFKRPASDICQVRLDFIDFNLAGPDQTTGDCTTDFMTFSGAENLISPFIICGQNDGQHLYLQYGSAETITASITLNNAMSTYDILATYIRCGSSSSSKSSKGSKGSSSNGKGRTFSSNSKGSSSSDDDSDDDNSNSFVIEPAPSGCSQYFTKSSGTIKSFNYGGDIMTPVAANSQFQTNNEKYTVCVKGGSAGSTITWSPCDSTTNSSFCVSGQWGATGQTGSGCLYDYVDIPGSQAGRYCGCAFPTSVTSSSRPFMMYVNFNEFEFPPPSAITDPSTGCPVGWACTDSTFEPLDPPPVGMDCDDPMGIAAGNTCLAPSYFFDFLDAANTGFCLKYMVS